jgi:PQQ-dependent catabolism-associated CXXCW motif protein
MRMKRAALDRRPSVKQRPQRFEPVLTRLCATTVALLLLCSGCGYTGSNGYFYKTVDFTPRAHSKDQVMILLADTAPVAGHHHVGEVKVSRGTMDSDAALYDAMRDLGVKNGFDGVNDIVCGDNYSLTEPYICTGAAFVINEPAQQDLAPAPSAAPATLSPPTRFYAEENVDFGVKPQTNLETDVGTPTPTSLPTDKAKTISTQQISQFKYPLLVDVLNGDHQYTIKGAFYLPEGGYPGNFADQHQKSFISALRTLTGDKNDVPIIFYCLGARCWESYNAALRASADGYRAVYWYRGGLNAWMQAGNAVEPLKDVIEDMEELGLAP